MGRPRVKGARLGSLVTLATTARFIPATVSRYGTTTVHLAAIFTAGRVAYSLPPSSGIL